MFGQRFLLFIVAQALFAGIAIFLAHSPYLNMSVSPTGSKPWADGPMKLVTTPQYETKKDADKADFIGYSQTWFKFVKSHHDDEEENLFPKVQELLGNEPVWDETHHEHESFLAPLAEFNTYLSNLASPTDLDSAQVIKLLDSFKEPFENHFHSEISTIAALSNHPKAPKENTPEGAAAGLTFKTWGKKTVTKAGVLDVVPFFLLNLDRTAEEGMWANWPPMPAPISWGLTNIAGSWYGKYWKFSSCDSQGKPQELYALRDLKQ
ncbi:hypothetical protein FBEOM_2811 [Fusarium beomiforme]|uniref:Hemerythrin-like domain-containing protein n=1 Tax=Fusarium beomiforme TaxID=44412 RepID=A0A9P5AQU0_9HYPO|nr:hypothetical protein FBEOM_2811 [Fusarium beomiforme]